MTRPPRRIPARSVAFPGIPMDWNSMSPNTASGMNSMLTHCTRIIRLPMSITSGSPMKSDTICTAARKESAASTVMICSERLSTKRYASRTRL